MVIPDGWVANIVGVYKVIRVDKSDTQLAPWFRFNDEISDSVSEKLAILGAITRSGCRYLSL